MTGRTRHCGPGTVTGRMRKAAQFLDAAEAVRELAGDEATGDAFVTLCIHAGIAAADVICCVALGGHALGDSHDEAVGLLRKVRPGGNDLAKALAGLLAMKTRASYGETPVSREQPARARRAASALVDAARRWSGNGSHEPPS